jgi:hypothetical protein
MRIINEQFEKIARQEALLASEIERGLLAWP